MAAPLQAQTLKGFRDYLPEAMAPRQAMIRAIEDTFARHGFLPLQTPALEYEETLMGKYGEEGDKLLYRFEDNGQRRVALRYDLTVPLARVVAQHRNELQLPFRRYHIAPVWRAEKPQRGRFREFLQCDADIAGVNTPLADAEVLVTGLEVLRSLGVSGARLHLNHRDVLFGLLELRGITEKAQQIACIRAVDKLDKIGPAGVLAEIVREAGLDAEAAQQVVDAFAPGQGLQELQQTVADAGDSVPVLRQAVERLQAVLSLVAAAGLADRITVDVSIARGLDYYTGIIYETRLTDPKVASMGAVMSGGRYDGLIGLFSKEQVPAVGISLGLDRLLAALQELGLLPTDLARVPVYVAVMDTQLAGQALHVAGLLRAAGQRVEVDLGGGKLGKQLERASKRGAQVVLVLGSDEVANATAVVKDLGSGQQTQVAWTELPAFVGALLK